MPAAMFCLQPQAGSQRRRLPAREQYFLANTRIMRIRYFYLLPVAEGVFTKL